MTDMKSSGKKSVRFGGHLADVIEENKCGIPENYMLIVQQIEDPLIKSSHLSEMLKQFIDIVNILDQDQKKLVHRMLSIRWVNREKEVIELFQKFLLELVAANSVHQLQVLNCLITHFIPASCLSNLTSCETCVPQEEIFHIIHGTLKKIFTLIPLTTNIVLPLLVSHYPFIKKDKEALDWYIKNLLFLTTYRVNLRPQILELIISKSLKLDTHCPRESIKKSMTSEEHDLFEMETDNSMKKEGFVDKLDIVMETLLQFIHDICYSNGELSLQADTLLKELVSIFDKVILPIHDSSHIQFLIFYICSFEKSFSETFLNHLWRKVQDPSAPMILRQTSLSYIASFLARAKYLHLNCVLTILNAMTVWIHCYIKEREGLYDYIGPLHETVRHGAFYSACQAVFYIIIFRHKQILDLPKGFEIMRKFNLEHIIMSRLNPLKFCISTVVGMFSSLMRQHQLVYCDTIIERNNRMTLPVCGQSKNSASVNPLDCFFPFDPYLLKSSSHMIEEIYQEWEGRVPELKDESRDEDHHIDNELMSASPISIPSIFSQDKHFIDSISGKSMSPGFSLLNKSSF
uniref:RNA polymerase I-specific transcription initiation factor RRN3-like n=1 Tax=Styela clava TaxID=7725 RepID=UPI0019399C04|nr:RNA polymerase I-specific transcription initiation factor RRN3-like [Styela clava]